ncbi:MAG: host attachment protein [Steroidobacteraceae bacterium]
MAGYRIVVADTRHADFFELAAAGSPLKKTGTLTNPYTASFDRELGADAPGRQMVRSATGLRRTTLDPRSSHKAHATTQFARLLAQSVARDVRLNHGDGLVLIAAPRFLTELRSQLPGATRRRVISEVPRDLIDLPRLELQKRVEKAVRRIVPG